MDSQSQRMFIAIALIFTGFMLWQEWDKKQNPNEYRVEKISTNNNVVNKDLKKNENEDIPAVATLKKDKNLTDDLPDTRLKKSTSNYPSILVETDLLAVRISKKGGTIENVSLNKYPISLKQKDKNISLLYNNDDAIFNVQSGLVSKYKLPNHHSIYQSEKDKYVLEGDTLVVPLIWQDDNGVVIKKNYYFKRDSYIISSDYIIENQSFNDINLSSYIQIMRNKPIESGSRMMPTFVGGAFYDKENKYQKIDFDEFQDNNKRSVIGGWMAMVEHYFLTAVLPDTKKQQSYSTKVINDDYFITLVNQSLSVGKQSTTSSQLNKIYVGPKEQVRLENISDSLDRTVDYGVLYIVAKPLSWILNEIYKFVRSWGWSIIILTILIKLVFYKLSEKSYRSMAKMRTLSPKMQRLKETYGDDKQKISQKMMELYKQEKVNPASGCLPILIQIPVFIALYWVLLESVELRQTNFWWLPDLAAKDPYFILPIVMGASMFVQQKLNPPPPDPMQAKLMMALPFVFTVFFLWFPSGLVLYWTVNNILSIVQQWVITKKVADKVASKN